MVIQTRNELKDRASLSLRRAWIEMSFFRWLHKSCRSLSLRRAWIEIDRMGRGTGLRRSLSLRRAWIEMGHVCRVDREGVVALLTESVD